MNRLRPLNSTTTTTTATATDPRVIQPLKHLSLVQQKKNQQEQALLLTEDEGSELETSAELSEAISTERIKIPLQFMDTNKHKRAQKKFWKL